MHIRPGQFFAERKRVDVENLLQTINRYLPVRHRHFLTRRDTIRLRYLVLPGAGLVSTVSMLALLAIPAMTSQTGGELAYEPVVLGPTSTHVAENDDGESVFSRFASSQKRLQRSAEVAERLAMLDPSAGETPKVVPQPDHKPEIKLPEGPQEKTVKIGSGDTLTGILSRAGLSSAEAYNVVQAIKKHVDPRSLKPGQTLQVKFDPVEGDDETGYQFASLNMAVDPLRTVSVARDGEESYTANLHEREMKKRLYAQDTEVQVSLFGSAAKSGIPQSVVAEAIRIYSWDIDFQRDVHKGDRMELMYEQYETEDGQKIKTGNVIYAKLTLNGEEVPIYRYETQDGRIDYFMPNGHSIKKTLMQTPIDGARVSSGFGMRKHPIQGYHKMHKGIDFAAPTGTPIYAAGDGVIQKASRFSSYGNYVKIRHNNQISTAYAHMSRYAKGITPGKRVKQGDVIGYVGTTGNSTGAHLHYEVLLNGAQVNPRGVNLPTGEVLQGEQLRLFQAHMRSIDRDFNSQRNSMKLAQNTVQDMAVER